MLTIVEIDALRHKAKHGQRPIEGEIIYLHYIDGPLDGLDLPARPWEASCYCTGLCAVTPSGCVFARYEGKPGTLVRRFTGYERPGGEATPGAYRRPAQ